MSASTLQRSPSGKLHWMIWLAGGLPLTVAIVLAMIVRGEYVNEPLHAFLELAGGCMALGVALLLWLRLRHALASRYFLWIVAGLVAMGVADTFHGSLGTGIAWSWMRHLATLLGGLLFACVWFPVRDWLWLGRKPFLGIILLTGGLLCFLVWKYPAALPLPWTDSDYTLWPKVVNVVGGVGFILTTIFLSLRFLAEKKRDDLVFAGHTVLFGISGLLFPLSHVWGAEWWLWHLLRFSAYIIVVVAAYRTVQRMTEELIRSEADLKALVQERTQSLAESEQQFRELFETTGDGVYLLDGNLRFVAVNRAAREMLKDVEVELGAMRGKTIWEIFPEMQDNRAGKELRHVMERRVPAEFENHYAPLGRWFHVRMFPQTNGGVAIFFRDISARKQAADSLRESEERFRAVAENIPQLAWMTDADGNILWYNRRWFDYTGTTLQEMQGLGWERVHHPDYGGDVSRRWREALSKGISWEDTFPLRGRDGHYRWFLSRAFPIRDQSGQITRWFGTNTDVTDLREAQEALKEAQKDLEEHANNLERVVAERTAALKETNEQMEAFIYTVAHDLRAPLRAQQGFAAAILEDYGKILDEQGRAYAGKIIVAANRLNELVGDLLEFSRITRGEMKLGRLDLHRIVLDAVRELSFEIEETRARIQVEPCDFYARGHEPIVRTAITNLLTNALKYSKPGQIPEVRIWAEVRQKRIRLWVEDNGIGISSRYHQKIFGMFTRLHNAGDYDGTGVGLAIVKKGIERMGGQVGVESQENAGSRFWIELEKS